MDATYEAQDRIRKSAQRIAELFCITGAEAACTAGIVEIVMNERTACMDAVMNATEPGDKVGAWFFKDAIRNMK